MIKVQYSTLMQSNEHAYVFCAFIFTFIQRQASWPSNEGSGETCFSLFWAMNMEEGKL